ncbi:biotin--[acetyl-CoA-carboxylase] ligase [Paenibacillus larvae]|uniref:Bifunctional ligase/repressor BirA n=4 Tax=Paenibacillus larvae TaxID=1464 RepID=V9W5J8_9BACL|nr:biotin--[acetyl-CoA-carboxylase] ligase [Paenibacillus larvae]AHD05224.1 bifunctional protein BirA [Paenibacillus larvae subsp. larvae DSM 25430]AQR79467.1 bifunctional biotin--[acetyl-CoA-carboxylase] synthetase/biotin operon repressor [Paenibacillus larvae subsp. larvae]AQT86275.1 bifunctional biotin--[acetyl-CoA-carboxylase] synthetase/biotin operon repressor [Paenibacillus larvae subsp. pulvifaciens]AQZ47917.1 bifunctional biotin--[acetyl-CoA-carboxylase] synthetase/biotin operon repress
MIERILAMFEQNPGEYLSGEQLSRELGVSRTAIWKHIQAMKQQGYRFEASRRKGYKLLEEPERLDVERLKSLLKTDIFGQTVHYAEETASTQNLAASLVSEGAKHGTLVVADAQNQGRGRHGRHWFSPKGKGIYMSLLLRPKVPIFFAPQLTLVAAVALCRTIQKLYGLNIGIKWPNDLLIGGRKVSGILLEISGEDERLKHIIAGIGISANIEAGDFPEDLREVATSLEAELGYKVDREELIAAFLQEFEQIYVLYMEKGFAPIRTLWEAQSISLHRTIRVRTSDGEFEGIAECLDDAGALVVRTPGNKIYKMYSGEVDIPAQPE